MTTYLKERSALAVRGEDARAFLQDIVSADMNRLDERTPLYALLLTPQGKLRYDFFIWQLGATCYLECESVSADALRDALLLYRLRRDVEITREDKVCVRAAWGDADALPYDDPRGANAPSLKNKSGAPAPSPKNKRGVAAGTRAFALAAPTGEPNDDAYRAHRIILGLAEGSQDMPPEQCFPLQYGLHAARALDWQKGCFIGQEVAARQWRLGNIRKRLYPVEFADAAPPQGCEIVKPDGRVVGEIRASSGARALALLREDALDSQLSANGAPFTRHAPFGAT